MNWCVFTTSGGDADKPPPMPESRQSPPLTAIRTWVIVRGGSRDGLQTFTPPEPGDVFVELLRPIGVPIHGQR
jgi:hypothetical protein